MRPENLSSDPCKCNFCKLLEGNFVRFTSVVQLGTNDELVRY